MITREELLLMVLRSLAADAVAFIEEDRSDVAKRTLALLIRRIDEGLENLPPTLPGDRHDG